MHAQHLHEECAGKVGGHRQRAEAAPFQFVMDCPHQHKHAVQ